MKISNQNFKSVIEMLSSINFLFLLSLGFISWIILCYFKGIENHFMEKLDAINDPFAGYVKPDLKADIASTDNVRPTTTTTCHDNSNIYINTLCLSLYLYVVIKITIMCERYITKYIRSKYHLKVGEQNSDSATDIIHNEIIKEMRENQEKLLTKIESLEKQNTILKRIIYEKEYCDLNSRNFEPKSEPHTGNLQNIFISNRHFHLNKQVFIKERDVTSTDETHSLKKLNTNNVWNKYLELQQSASVDSVNHLTSTTQIATITPVVLSQDDLKDIF